jgi:hypothetical protein
MTPGMADTQLLLLLLIIIMTTTIKMATMT